MTEGKWCCSTDEEQWNCDEEFDTPEQALAYALNELAPDYGLDDGDSVYIGQIRAVSLDSMAACGVDADSILDAMACWLHDNVGEDFVDSLPVSKEQADDLEARLTKTIREWLDAHSIKPDCHHIEGVKIHKFEQCAETRVVPHDDHEDITERCLLSNTHEGAHEWP